MVTVDGPDDGLGSGHCVAKHVRLTSFRIQFDHLLMRRILQDFVHSISVTSRILVVTFRFTRAGIPAASGRFAICFIEAIGYRS